jgi:hypothetical protein
MEIDSSSGELKDGEVAESHLYSNSESAYFSEYNMATGMAMVIAIEMDDWCETKREAGCGGGMNDAAESMSSPMMSRE